MISDEIGIGENIAQNPRTTRRLKIFDPTTLLRASSLEWLRAAVVLTANSGALVPNATIVRPMTSSETLNFFAREALPSTNMSAPFTRAANPAAKTRKYTNIMMTDQTSF